MKTYYSRRTVDRRPGGFRAWDRDRHELAASAEAIPEARTAREPLSPGGAPSPASTGRARRRPHPPRSPSANSAMTRRRPPPPAPPGGTPPMRSGGGGLVSRGSRAGGPHPDPLLALEPRRP